MANDYTLKEKGIIRADATKIYPSVDAMYGPWASVAAFRTYLGEILGGTVTDDIIPNSVEIGIIQSDGTVNRYEWQKPTNGEGQWISKSDSGGAVASVNGKTGAVVLSKSDIGLGNVDNTSDVNKPISTATQTALNAKANASDLTAHTGSTSNPHGVTKAQVGLGNVDNTADADKIVKRATEDGSGNVITSTYETKTDAQSKITNLASDVADTYQTKTDSASAHTNLQSQITAIQTTVSNLTGLDGTNFGGFSIQQSDSLAVAGITTLYGQMGYTAGDVYWFLAGTSMASLKAYRFDGVQTDPVLISNDVYDFTDFSGLQTKVDKFKGTTNDIDSLNSGSNIGIYFYIGASKMGLVSVAYDATHSVVTQHWLSDMTPDSVDPNVLNEGPAILMRTYKNSAWSAWQNPIGELAANVAALGLKTEGVINKTELAFNFSTGALTYRDLSIKLVTGHTYRLEVSDNPTLSNFSLRDENKDSIHNYIAYGSGNRITEFEAPADVEYIRLSFSSSDNPVAKVYHATLVDLDVESLSSNAISLKSLGEETLVINNYTSSQIYGLRLKAGDTVESMSPNYETTTLYLNRADATSKTINPPYTLEEDFVGFHAYDSSNAGIRTVTFKRRGVVASSSNKVETKVNDVENALYRNREQINLSLYPHRYGSISVSSEAGWASRSSKGHFCIPVKGGCVYSMTTATTQYLYCFLAQMPIYDGDDKPQSYPVFAEGYVDQISLPSGKSMLVAPWNAKYLYVKVLSSWAIPTLHFERSLVARMESVLSSGNYAYSGRKIDVAKPTCRYFRIGDTTSSMAHQGGAIFEGKFFFCNSDGVVTIYDIDTNTVVSTFTLSQDPQPHCNSVFFGGFYDDDDDYPVLYVNSYQSQLPRGTIYGYRISHSGGVYSATLVQTITIGFTDTELWTDSGSARPFGNFAYDKDLNVLVAFSILDTANITRFFEFSMPSADGGDITLGVGDILNRFDTPYIKVPQDACAYGGKVFIASGFGYDYNPGLINVVDMTEQALVSVINLLDWGNAMEPEYIDFYNGNLIVGNRYIYNISF